MKFTVAGLDPSLSNLGIVKAILYLNDEKKPCKLDLTRLRLVSTSSQRRTKKAVRVNSQDLDRCKQLYDGLLEELADVDLVFIELPVGSQSARAMVSYGACIMLAATIQKPLFIVTPDEVKAVTKNKRASKAAMIEWATSKFPNAPWLTHNGKITNNNEHLADALAAIISGVKTDQFKEAIGLMPS